MIRSYGYWPVLTLSGLVRIWQNHGFVDDPTFPETKLTGGVENCRAVFAGEYKPTLRRYPGNRRSPFSRIRQFRASKSSIFSLQGYPSIGLFGYVGNPNRFPLMQKQTL
jgi:hypothetical protein